MRVSRALAVCLFLAPSCAPASDSPALADPAPAVTPLAPAAPPACERLRGAQFRQRAPEATAGAALLLESVVFSEDGKSYTWTKDGSRSTSSCECNGGTIRARGTTLTSDTDFTATYDAAHDVLRWQGTELERVAEPAR